MSKPLVPLLGIDGKKQSIVYEGLPSICYECGKVGHIKEKCDQRTIEERTGALTKNTKQGEETTSREMEGVQDIVTKGQIYMALGFRLQATATRARW